MPSVRLPSALAAWLRAWPHLRADYHLLEVIQLDALVFSVHWLHEKNAIQRSKRHLRSV